MAKDRNGRTLFPGEPPKDSSDRRKVRLGGVNEVDSRLREAGHTATQAAVLAMIGFRDFWPWELREEFFGQEEILLEDRLIANRKGKFTGAVIPVKPWSEKVILPQRFVKHVPGGKVIIR